MLFTLVHIFSISQLSFSFCFVCLLIFRRRFEIETRQLNKKQKLEKERNEGKDDGEKEKEKVEDEDTLVVPFSACLNTFFSEETIQCRNPSIGATFIGPAVRTTKMGTLQLHFLVLFRYLIFLN